MSTRTLPALNMWLMQQNDDSIRSDKNGPMACFSLHNESSAGVKACFEAIYNPSHTNSPPQTKRIFLWGNRCPRLRLEDKWKDEYIYVGRRRVTEVTYATFSIEKEVRKIVVCDSTRAVLTCQGAVTWNRWLPGPLLEIMVRGFISFTCRWVMVFGNELSVNWTAVFVITCHRLQDYFRRGFSGNSSRDFLY